MKMSSLAAGLDDPDQLVVVLRLMAMRPSRRDESYSVKRVFLTWPFLVAKNRKRLVS